MMRVSHCAAASLAAVLVLGGSAAQAQQQFNGSWSVQVITEKGECNPTYQLPVVIEGGRARYEGSDSANAFGSVSSAGAVNASLSWGGSQANIKGRLAGAAGSGTWMTTGSRNCSGRWVGQRRS